MIVDAMEQQTFGDRLKEYRLNREWTLAQLAAVCGLAPNTVWQIENNKVKPHELTVHKIKKALPGLIRESVSHPEEKVQC